MATYAKDTQVAVSKSKAEIEDTLRRYGAQGFAYQEINSKVQIAFMFVGIWVRFNFVLPDMNAKEFQYSSRGKRRPEVALAEWEKACRQKWRALALVIKAKLEAVDAGIVSLEEEFAPNVVMPDGQTFGEWALPQINKMYLDGKMPGPLLLTAK